MPQTRRRRRRRFVQPLAAKRPQRDLVDAIHGHLHLIDAYRTSLEAEVGRLASLVNRNARASDLIFKFYSTGGVTADDFADWAAAGARRPAAPVGRRGIIRLVSSNDG